MEFTKIVSPYNLRNSWIEIKTSNEKKLSYASHIINDHWFLIASRLLLSQKTKYFQWRDGSLLALKKDTIEFNTQLKVKIVERALASALWVSFNKEKLLNFHENKISLLHKALKNIKNVNTEKTWGLHCCIELLFNKINKKRLKNIFLAYTKKHFVWNEVSKLIESNHVNLNKIENKEFIFKRSGEKRNNNVLANFLINIYLNELDVFVNGLKNQKPSNVFHYVRFENDCLLLINGPKSFINKIHKQICEFIKSNLHFKVKSIHFTNLNTSSINFLNFNIKLKKSWTQPRVKSNSVTSLVKYRKRVTNRLLNANAKFAKTTIFHLKKNLLKSFHTLLIKRKSKYNMKRKINLNSPLIVKKLTQKNDNVAIQRWSQNFNKLFKKKASLSLQYYYDQINNLSYSKKSLYYFELLALKQDFLDRIKKIEKKAKLKSFDVLKKDKKQLPIQLNNILTNASLDLKKSKKLVIEAPIKEIIELFAKKGFYSPIRQKPIAKISFCQLSDSKILKQYSKIMLSLLDYYRIVNNLNNLKRLVETLWRSCVYTLAFKHKKSVYFIYKSYGREIKLKAGSKKIVSLPTKKDILNWPIKTKQSLKQKLVKKLQKRLPYPTNNKLQKIK